MHWTGSSGTSIVVSMLVMAFNLKVVVALSQKCINFVLLWSEPYSNL